VENQEGGTIKDKKGRRRNKEGRGRKGKGG
jgi:hypothetical protein